MPEPTDNPLPPTSARPAASISLPVTDPSVAHAAEDRGRSASAADSEDLGWVHSHENASTVDGPGFRYVVWLSGCHLRCQYCHNPDTWAIGRGRRMSVDDILHDAKRFADFLRNTHGGLTVSGGEPLVQAPFAIELLRRAKAELSLDTALDTNGYLGQRLTDRDFDAIDLVLLDLKAFTPEHHRRVTGFDNAEIMTFAQRLADLGQRAWVRYVLVPGLTDQADEVRSLAEFVAPMGNVERVEVLPFHQMGRQKWHELGQAYPLDHTPAATPEQAARAEAIFRDAGCPLSP